MIKLEFDGQQDLAAALMATQVALRVALSDCAKCRGTADLSWFDEIAAEAVKSFKGTIVEEMPIEREAGSLRFGLEFLETILKQIRGDLVKEQD